MKFPPAQRAALLAVRDVAVRALPGATQVLAYGMPALRLGGPKGDGVLAFDGFTKHNSLFPMSGGVISQCSLELADFDVSKGTIHFALDQPFPAQLLKRVAAIRLAEINASYPRASGETKAFYAGGQLKYRGRMKEGFRHGAWEFFRVDGTLKRAGRFDRGNAVGQWAQYGPDGAAMIPDGA